MPLRFATFRSKLWVFATFRAGSGNNADALTKMPASAAAKGAFRILRFEAYVSYVSGDSSARSPRFGAYVSKLAFPPLRFAVRCER